MGLFYSSPSKPKFFRIGRGASLPMRPLKNPGNTTLTWFLKLLNRIRALPPNLALGMKTHIGKLSKPEMSKLKACLNSNNKAADGLDIALFGRMVAQEPSVNIQAAAAFSHAITTHKVANEVEFFTALDDLQQDPGAAHMGSLEYNSGTYYRYISLDLGQLWENLGGCEEDIKKAIDVFVKALYIAVPSARQNCEFSFQVQGFGETL